MKLINMNGNKYYTITETVYQRIKDSILKGKYKNGRLLLHDLANDMNVSITPIREALKKLEKDGLINIIPNKGAVINQFTFKDVKEIYDIRLQLESMAIELLMKKNNKKILEGLERLVILSEKSVENNDLKLSAECCHKFHKFLVSASDNTRLIKFYNELDGQLSILMDRTAYFSNESKRSSLEHRKIFEAIREDDLNLAKMNIGKHIANAKEDILERSKNIFIKASVKDKVGSMEYSRLGDWAAFS